MLEELWPEIAFEIKTSLIAGSELVLACSRSGSCSGSCSVHWVLIDGEFLGLKW